MARLNLLSSFSLNSPWRAAPLLCAISPLLATALSSSVALAEDRLEEARVLYQKGNASFKKGDDVMAREYYRESLTLHESFDTVCNLGRTLARSKLYPESYEQLRMCIYLYPEDRELAAAREKFVGLRDEVRNELSFDQQHEIDERVDKEIAHREEALRAPASGLDEPSGNPAPVAEPDAVSSGSSAKLPVTIVAGSLGLIGVGVGVGFFIGSGSEKSAAEELRDDLSGESVNCATSTDARCEDLADHAKKVDSMKTVGIVGVAAGSALLAGATLAYFLWPEADATATHVTPHVAVNEQGTWQWGLSGTF